MSEISSQNTYNPIIFLTIKAIKEIKLILKASQSSNKKYTQEHVCILSKLSFITFKQ